jgi:hypothetical protein
MQTPSSEQRRSVRALAEIGMSDQEIATQLQLSLKKLRKFCKRELNEGAAEGNRQVLEHLYQAAKSGSNMGAAALWVKARCGWRDTGVTAQSGTLLRSKLVIVTKSPDAHRIQPEA